MNLDASAIISIVSIGLVSLIGLFISAAWKKVTGSASTEKVTALEKKVDEDVQSLEARIDLIGSRFMDQFQKFESVLAARLEKFEDEIKQITREGIASGAEARKEQWKEIRDLSDRLSAIEGYMSTANGYKPRPRAGG